MFAYVKYHFTNIESIALKFRAQKNHTQGALKYILFKKIYSPQFYHQRLTE